jgi:hypothetical protein
VEKAKERQRKRTHPNERHQVVSDETKSGHSTNGIGGGLRSSPDRHHSSKKYDGTSIAHLLRAERRSKLHKNRADLQQFWTWTGRAKAETSVNGTDKVNQVKNMQDLYLRALQQKHIADAGDNGEGEADSSVREVGARTRTQRPSPHRANCRRPLEDEERGSVDHPTDINHPEPPFYRSPSSPGPVGLMLLTEDHLQQVAKYFGPDESSQMRRGGFEIAPCDDLPAVMQGTAGMRQTSEQKRVLSGKVCNSPRHMHKTRTPGTANRAEVEGRLDWVQNLDERDGSYWDLMN